jgi:hypothetical protein
MAAGQPDWQAVGLDLETDDTADIGEERVTETDTRGLSVSALSWGDSHGQLLA